MTEDSRRRQRTVASGIRGAKNAMSRQIIGELDKAGIGIASATYDIVCFPPIKMRGGKGAAVASD